MKIQERFTPAIMALNSTRALTGPSIGGFICVTTGTLTVNDSAGTAILSAFPVTAGNSYRIPMYVGQNGGSVVLAGGASGTLLV